MTAAARSFRLLDGRVGWDPRPGDGEVGVNLTGGTLQLASVGTSDAGNPDAWLDRSADGTWWLGGRAGLRRMSSCDDRFRAWREKRRMIDLTARGRRVAVVLSSGRCEVFDTATGQLLVAVWVQEAARVELSRDGSLTVTDRHGRRTFLDPSGLVCAADPPCRPGDPLPPTPTRRSWPTSAPAGLNGFTIPGRGSFDWNGCRVDGATIASAGGGVERKGQFLSAALDSGIPGCVWHRIRIDADVPDGTRLEVAFATTDGPAAGRMSAAPDTQGDWAGFPAGDPHPADWVPVPAGADDSILSCPPGRYGYVRIRLVGTGDASPSVHQVRLDMPRATSLEHLPAAYSEDPEARDFTERFLSVLDAELEEIDEVLARRSALLDADALPPDALSWLAGLLGTGFEAEMTVSNRRAMLRAAPTLFRRRGTPQGLVDTLQIALGVESTVEEMGATRPWGALGVGHLGSLRLFSRSVARFRLGSSQLGVARVEGRGNPDQDALLSGANRIRVHVPAGTDTALVTRIVRSQIPAHVACTVHAAAAGFVATTLRLGIDTTLVPPASAVVGDISLGRRGVVPPGRAAGAPFVVGGTAGSHSRASEGKEMEYTC